MSEGIVIVGGGAGGLELACQLGRKLGAGRVSLVDRRLFHVWKPSLHEVAAGTLDIHQEGLSYLMLAHDNGFDFVYGALQSLDTAARTITVGEITALPVKPAGVFINGDCAYLKGLPDDYANLAQCVAPLSAAGLPLHVTMGNHDDRGPLYQALQTQQPNGLGNVVVTQGNAVAAFAGAQHKTEIAW